MSLILSGTDGLSDVDGSASTPAIRGTDANTGMFFPAADTIAFSEGGVESMRINSSGQVGIGTASPDERLTIQGNYKQSNGTQGIQIVNTTVPYIQAFTSGGNNPLQINGQDLRFFTGSSFGAESEKMRITAAGLIGINTTIPTSPLTMANNSRFAALNTGGADVSLAIVNGSNDVFFGDDSVNTGTATWRSRAASVFQVNLVERMRLNNSGALVLQGGNTTANGVGITFPATQSASSDANTLDDYEEGTWTPQIGGSSTGMASVTYVTQNGKYTKIGDTVFITMQLQWSAASGGTGDARVYGLPFTCPDSFTAFACSQFINLGVGTDFQMRSDANTRLAPQTASGASGLSLSSYTTGSFNKSIAVAGCYKV